MPRCYVTLEQRRKSNFEKQSRMENALVGKELKTAMKKNKLRYDDLCRVAEISNGTLSKAIHNPQSLNLDKLRKICYSAGLNLTIDVEQVEK